MIGESLNFMIIGMSVVFLFLIIMVFVLHFQGLMINKYVDSDDVMDEAQEASSTSSGPIDAKKVAMISAAVKQHINENK